MAWYGSVRYGTAGRGRARLGEVWHGMGGGSRKRVASFSYLILIASEILRLITREIPGIDSWTAGARYGSGCWL